MTMIDPVQLVCPHCDTINRVPGGRLAEAPNCGACGTPLFGGRPVPLSEARLRRHIRHDGIPLLVDFWAPWCGPCRAMAPEFEAAARSLEPRMRLAKVNTEEAPGLAADLRISGIPTIALFSGAREVARSAGAMPARRIVEWASRAAGGA